MDDFLASQGLWRKPTAKDSSGLFRAFAEQVSKEFKQEVSGNPPRDNKQSRNYLQVFTSVAQR